MRSHLIWENQRAFIASPLCGKKREEEDEEVEKEEGGRGRKKNKERSTRHFQRKQRQAPAMGTLASGSQGYGGTKKQSQAGRSSIEKRVGGSAEG